MSPQTVAGPLQVVKFLQWAARSPTEECGFPWQVPTTFPNSTGDVLLQFAGVWHVTAIAFNCSIFLKMRDGMKSSMAIISFMPEGDLAMKLVWPLMHKCQKFEPLFQRSGQAGHYTGMSREQDLSPQLLQKFMELIPTMGLTKDMLVILPKSGEWPKGTGWQLWPLCMGAQGVANGTLTPLFAFQQISAPGTSAEVPCVL
ncbi:lipocalin-15-like isoform X2 [Poecile atricapillus]|uniref:lipocalin-15-like isoform X2 n=1 Tax=Poecile atricapillus TaxID=48891 RepID=UPI002738455C|nr:lipocalin-15-like isoform X2 [Poecile atricapillus]